MAAGQYKILLLGAVGSGKSSLAIKYAHGQYIEGCDAGIEEKYHVHRDIGGNIEVIVTDPCDACEAHQAYIDTLVRQHQGFLVCFAVDDRGSFNHAISFLKRIAAIKRSQDSALTVVCALVATKADLPPVVSDDEIALLSSNVGCSWYKLSARVGAGGDHPTTRSMEVASVSPPFTYVIQRLQANEGLDLCDMFSSMSVGEEKKNEEECVIL